MGKATGNSVGSRRGRQRMVWLTVPPSSGLEPFVSYFLSPPPPSRTPFALPSRGMARYRLLGLGAMRDIGLPS